MKALCALLILALGIAFACQATPANKATTVLLLARRSGTVEFVDPATLASIGSIHTGSMTDWVAARPGSSTLLLARSQPSEPRKCCALYSLDLETLRTRFLIFPAQRGVLSPDGHQLFVQRGNVGIDTIDLLAFEHGPSIGLCGKTYLVAPSPSHRRWLFGVANWPTPSLDIFDRKTNALARRLEVSRNSQLTGAWLGNTFYLLGYGNGRGTLWSVTPETEKLPAGKPVDLHDFGKECRSRFVGPSLSLILQGPVAARGLLMVYEAFGLKLDRRDCASPPTGGVYVIEPSSGAVVAHLAPSLYFMQVIASCDGSELYGIALGPTPGRGPVQLVRLDARTGKVLASREIGKEEKGPDAVHVSLATLPDSLVPRGEVRAVESVSPSRAACTWTRPSLDEPPNDPNASPFGFGEWYINENRSVWIPRLDWRAGTAEKVIAIRPAGTKLEITGRRLDDSALLLQVLDRGGYPTGFVVLGVTIPAEGCWEITAKAGNDVLTFVTPVGPPHKTPNGRDKQRPYKAALGPRTPEGRWR